MFQTLEIRQLRAQVLTNIFDLLTPLQSPNFTQKFFKNNFDNDNLINAAWESLQSWLLKLELN